MDVLEAIKSLKADMVSNRAIARVNGVATIVARVVGNELVLTEEGKALAANIKPEPAQKPTSTTTTKKAPPKKRVRARNADGTLKGDDPSTPDVNEAWEDGDS
jgi:hypothetical protein